MRLFITGASRGLGKCVAEQAKLSGHKVLAVVRNIRTENSRHLQEMGIELFECDLSQLKSVKNDLIKNKLLSFDPDTIVLNASAIEDDFDNQLDFSKTENIINTNFLSPMAIVASLLNSPTSKKRCFIAISSFSAFVATDTKRIGYPSSKAALSMAFSSLRLGEDAKKARFITFEPGRMSQLEGSKILSYQSVAKKVLASAKSENSRRVIRIPFFLSIVASVLTLSPLFFQRLLFRK